MVASRHFYLLGSSFLGFCREEKYLRYIRKIVRKDGDLGDVSSVRWDRHFNHIFKDLLLFGNQLVN